MESAATLILTFVASRIDYCNAVLVDELKVTIDKLQHVLNAAAPVVSNKTNLTEAYPDLGTLSCIGSLYSIVPERVISKLINMMYSAVCMVKLCST